MRWLAGLLVLLSTQVAAQFRPVPVTQPDIPLRFELFSIKPPSGPNWFFVQPVTPEGVLFGKPPREPGHTLLAWAVAKRRAEKVEDLPAYLAAIRPELERRLPPGRHTILESDIKPFEKYPDACVRFWFKATDQAVKGREGVPQNFLIAGVHCVEPRERIYNIDLNYSERSGPERWSEATQAEAEAFFASLLLTK